MLCPSFRKPQAAPASRQCGAEHTSLVRLSWVPVPHTDATGVITAGHIRSHQTTNLVALAPLIQLQPLALCTAWHVAPSTQSSRCINAPGSSSKAPLHPLAASTTGTARYLPQTPQPYAAIAPTQLMHQAATGPASGGPAGPKEHQRCCGHSLLQHVICWGLLPAAAITSRLPACTTSCGTPARSA
jgi:hypothetical protein